MELFGSCLLKSLQFMPMQPVSTQSSFKFALLAFESKQIEKIIIDALLIDFNNIKNRKLQLYQLIVGIVSSVSRGGVRRL